MKKKLFTLTLTAMLVMTVCAAPAYAEEAAEAAEADAAGADALTGITYTYLEETPYGFTVTWEMILDDTENATINEINDVAGNTVYSATWTYEDGNVVTVLTGSDTGSMPQADFFDSANDYQCVWEVSVEDASMTPVSSGSAEDGTAEDDLGLLDGSDASADSSEITDASASAELSEDSGASLTADFSDVAYAGDSDSQVLDIYLPEGEGTFPVIVVVHGGGFMFGDQGMAIIQPIISAGLENGYAVVSVDYRKSSEAQFPAALADVKAAVRFVRANAEEYSFDTDSIVIWGESAGAYLSVMTALTANVESLNGDVDENLDYSSEVTALVDFYGPIEFYVMDDEYAEMGIESSFGTDTSFESQFLGQNLSADEEYTYTTYWETYVDEFTNTDLIAWIQAGDSDTSVPCTESVNLADRLSELLGEDQVSFGLIEGAEHEDDLFYTDENLADVFEFLATVIGQ
ncbi:MAG: alpha/beta hydrolase [Lachnospiraceae bacterium]|nr:alpha/beta hydrolase [Lachnospiraceae bacterium]